MRRRLLPTVFAALGAAVVALLVFGLSQPGSSRALDNAVQQGRTPAAPDVTRALPVLNGVGGDATSLARWRGKVVVVNFWASWCTPCLAEAGLIEQAQRSLAANGAGTVVGIDYRDITSHAMVYVRRHRLTFPSLRDIDGSFAGAYGTVAVPETFVLDRRMRVVAISRGELPNEATLAGMIARAKAA